MPSNKRVKPALELIKKDPSKVLGLVVGKHNVTEPGQYVPRADAKSAPQLTYNASKPSPSTSYVVICLDLDAPFPSFPVLGPVLHWIQPGLRSSSAGGPLESLEPFIANYVGPGPPPGSPPHRYVFLLFEQPEGFDGKKFAPKDGKPVGIPGRMRSSLDDWVQKLGLEEVVAVNYFNSN